MAGWRARLTALLLAGSLTGAAACSGPARTDTSFASKAAATADQARSAVETVIVVVDSADRHQLPSPYVSTVIGEAEGDASSALSGFESVQPPSARSDAVRAKTTTVVGDAVDVLAQARIIARRGRAPVELLGELRHSARQLDALATSVER